MSISKSIPTYKRQRLLLALAEKLPEPATATDFQKIMFLCMMRTGRTDYEFVPYRYGPYSFQLAADIDTLRRTGFLPNGTHKIKATQSDFDFGDEVDYSIFIPSERGDALMRKVYRAYPYYTVNSEILQRLFHNEPTEMERLRAERQRLKQTEKVLFTVGYEGRSLEAFLNILLQNDIRVLCDVRKNPLSRKYGFSADKLEQVTQGTKIRYAPFPGLGIESEKRRNLDSLDDYNNLFADYRQTVPYRAKELERLYSVFEEEGRIALMCFEKDPAMCHRSVIRDYLCTKHPIRSADL